MCTCVTVCLYTRVTVHVCVYGGWGKRRVNHEKIQRGNFVKIMGRVVQFPDLGTGRIIQIQLDFQGASGKLAVIPRWVMHCLKSYTRTNTYVCMQNNITDNLGSKNI